MLEFRQPTAPRQRTPPLPRYLAIIGPTASGKTAASMVIAEHIQVEIISVDSALVYQGMDIGTAKPGASELAAVPHHLINIRDPLSAYSAAEFVADAQVLMADIHARGKLPLLVGGTMLYLNALRFGLDDMPRSNPSIRADLQAQAAQRGWPALHDELAQVDITTALRLAPTDAQRISRALEVFRATGRPLSSFHTSKSIAAHAVLTSVTGTNDINFQHRHALLISLEPQDRAWLHLRIEKRFDAMLKGGFLDEVAALRQRSDLHPDLPALRSVGYRQAWQALDGMWPMIELRDKSICATRQLAKRQITWLRSMPDRQVVACDAPDALQQVLAMASSFVGCHST